MPALLVALCLLSQAASAQNSRNRPPRLSEERFKSGVLTLRAFAPVAEAARESIVKLERDGEVAALGAIIDANGLVITKASEIKEGKLTCGLANGREVAAERVGVDDDNDVALVKVGATGLKSVEWASVDPVVGQWAVTPGIEPTPEAVGVISARPRKIHPPRALIGVQLDFNTSAARIGQVMADLGAARTGLKPGDVILAINDALVKSGEELVDSLRNFREGQKVKLRVQREEEEFEASVQMMAPKPEPTSRGFNREASMNRLGGEVSRRAAGFELALQHDTVLEPWQCGGPLVNLEGKAIGLNIARAGRVASYALPAALVKQIIEELKNRAQSTAKQEGL